MLLLSLPIFQIPNQNRLKKVLSHSLKGLKISQYSKAIEMILFNDWMWGTSKKKSFEFHGTFLPLSADRQEIHVMGILPSRGLMAIAYASNSRTLVLRDYINDSRRITYNYKSPIISVQMNEAVRIKKKEQEQLCSEPGAENS